MLDIEKQANISQFQIGCLESFLETSQSYEAAAFSASDNKFRKVAVYNLGFFYFVVLLWFVIRWDWCSTFWTREGSIAFNNGKVYGIRRFFVLQFFRHHFLHIFFFLFSQFNFSLINDYEFLVNIFNLFINLTLKKGKIWCFRFIGLPILLFQSFQVKCNRHIFL